MYRQAKPDEDGPNNAVDVSEGGTRFILEPVIYFTNDLGAHWVRQGLPANGDGYRIVGLNFIDEAHGIAWTEAEVLFTSDGGRHWQRSSLYGPDCSSGPKDPIERIHLAYLLNKSYGFLSADEGSVLSTSDGARTWCQVAPKNSIHSQFSNEPSHFISLAFRTRLSGWGVEMSGALLETQDGGRSWMKVPGIDEQFEQVLLLDQERGWALTGKQLLKLRVLH